MSPFLRPPDDNYAELLLPCSAAAARFGLQTIILPRQNEADLDDVPDIVREGMEFILVDTVDEVFEAAFTLPEEPARESNGAAAPVDIASTT